MVPGSPSSSVLERWLSCGSDHLLPMAAALLVWMTVFILYVEAHSAVPLLGVKEVGDISGFMLV